MLNQYETVFIMTPVLSEDQMKETVLKFKNFLTERGAEFVFEDNWGLRKLAYPIQKKSTGFYYLLEYRHEGDIVHDLEIAFKRDERIMRFLTIALNKHAIAYNEKKRREKKGKTEKVKEEVKQ